MWLSWLEHWVVAPEVKGSSPFTHPKRNPPSEEAELIVRCPSCQSRFTVDSSKISGPLSRGHCSVCGHVFTILDHAVEDVETAALRDRFEKERQEKIKKVIGGSWGVYGILRPEGEKVSEERGQTGLDGAVEVVSASRKEEKPEAEPLGRSEKISVPEELFDEERETSETKIAAAESVSERESETEIEPVSVAVTEREARPEEMAETPQGKTPREGLEETMQGTREEFSPREGEDLARESQDTKVEGSVEPEAEAAIAPEMAEAASLEESTLVAEGGGIDATSEPSGEPSAEPSLMDEALEPFESSKRRSILPVLIVILVLLGLGGGGWYLYQSGVLTSSGGITGKIMSKIQAIRGKSTLILFNLKNEQEPARDGKFFAVRGVVQNRRRAAVPYVPLKIKIFDARGKVILTGRTCAGRVLQPDDIAKMTVQGVLKTYRSMNAQNRKTAGHLNPGEKLPFLFLFDLSKFPRKTAKSFQVEVITP